MNHLAHFYLAGSPPELVVGGFLGDFIKGRLYGDRCAGLERGIRLHRAIDAFTDRNEILVSARCRFDPPFRRYAGIMTDIIFDHFLATCWEQYHDNDLQAFSDEVFSILLAHRNQLPDVAFELCRRMYRHNSLVRYRQRDFVENAFRYLSTRLSRANPLAEGYDQFLLHEEELAVDFQAFFPALIRFTDEWKADSAHI